MNPLTRTFAYVAVAVISVIAASSAWYGTQPSDLSGYGEVGQSFFEDFTDPAKARALTVVDYDQDAKEVRTFSVRQNDDGLWVIPSHHNYPAEASDRLAKTATSLLGVSKTAVQSRTKDDWKSYGVVDPSSDGTATGDERGTRLTLSDGSGNPLVDLIIGHQVEGRDGHYYVREPEKNTTYVARLKVDLSAKFSDWIEPDLLKVNQSDIVEVTLDNYSIDEQQGTVNKKELLTFTKKDLSTTGDWLLQGLDEQAEELDQSPVRDIARNLDQLKIVGVRPKPEGLDDNLKVNPVVRQILEGQMQALGYFIGVDRDGKERLYSNEGELIAGINNGVEYTLFFGEIARGTGKEIEVGLGDSATEKAAAEKPQDEKKSDETSEAGDAASAAEADAEESDEDGPRRYLLVKVGFNEALLGKKPEAPAEPVKPEILSEKAEPKADAKETDAKTEAPAEKQEPAKDAPKNKNTDKSEAAPQGGAEKKEAEKKEEESEKTSAEATDEAKNPGESTESSPEDSAETGSKDSDSADDASAGTDDELDELDDELTDELQSGDDSAESDAEQPESESADSAATNATADSEEAAVKSDETASADAAAEKSDDKKDTSGDEKSAAESDKAADEKAENKEPAPAKGDDKAADKPEATESKAAKSDAGQDAAGDSAKAEDKSGDKPVADDRKPDEQKEPEKDPKQAAQEEYDAALGRYEAEKKAYESDLKTFEDKVKTGKEKA
ncbi:MAG: DUF4340 domain-containing protein, partial [Planctomycetaceae bacterium]|nr:DUF4340 domain-containing protein [Planctomycetaceae bacterium]